MTSSRSLEDRLGLRVLLVNKEETFRIIFCATSIQSYSNSMELSAKTFKLGLNFHMSGELADKKKKKTKDFL
jgi:hypothetical protein